MKVKQLLLFMLLFIAMMYCNDASAQNSTLLKGKITGKMLNH